MNDFLGTTLEIRSEVCEDATLRLFFAALPLPTPGPDEVLVRISAAPLHPADIGLLLGPADLSSAEASGIGERRTVVFRISRERMAGLAARLGRSLTVGNEGAGIVVAAGERVRDMIGMPVSVMGGGMLTRHRLVSAADFLPIPEGVPVKAGAAVLINPFTALAMLETMRAEGHIALVHTAAASSLGQMLNRICLLDEVPLVSIVRRPDQVDLLRRQGARHVCDSTSPTFADDLAKQIAATGATLAFDAVGGGKLANEILSAMERHCLTQVSGYSRYGSKVRKQVYFYGGLDIRPSELDRGYGMSWGVGGWLIFDELERMSPARLQALRARISAEMQSTFASDFAGVLSMTELMDPENLKIIAARSTGAKFLIDPSAPLG